MCRVPNLLFVSQGDAFIKASSTYFESLKGIQLSSIWEGMCHFSTLRTWLGKKGSSLIQDKMLKLLSEFECDRLWRTISGSPISLTDQNSCTWSHMHFSLCGCDRGKKWDLVLAQVEAPLRGGDAQSPGKLHWEPQLCSEGNRQMQKQWEAQVGAQREDLRAAGPQTPCWGGADTHGATGDSTLAVDTQQENELFAKWKKRGWKIIIQKF